jgi:flagellar hook-associated protein 3 FlgL
VPRISELGRQTARLRILNAVTARTDALQRQIASGKRIQRPSDDPSGSAISTRIRRDISYEAQMRRNLQGGMAFINATEGALDSATTALQRVRELTVQASSDTLSGSERIAIGKEVEQLIQHLAQIGNSNFGGVYIFSGYQTQTPAYDVVGSPPSAVTYQGDNGLRVRKLSKQDAAAVNVTGATAFGTVFDDLLVLRNNLNGSQPGTVIASSLTGIDTALERILTARAETGASFNRFEQTLAQSEISNIDMQERRASIEDVDITDAIVRLSGQQASLQAALMTIGRVSELSLMNFMR